MYRALTLLVFVLSVNLSDAQDSGLSKLEWWQTSVFYHVYTRSFRDSNGDGIGDIKGLIEKLPQHLHDLGVGAVWVACIFKSPMVDFGYDISDFLTLDPMFGDNADLETLTEKLHALGIKILLDLVPNHTSNQHEWFKKSLANIPPYNDFYVWVEPKGWNGNEPIPPNNWETCFKESAWTFSPERKKFYFHHFTPEQPDLNYRNPLVVEAMNDIIRYWLRKGVDGFRVDAVQFLFEDAQLRDNPVINGVKSEKYSKNRPETYDMVRQWYKIVDEYSRATDGETKILLLEVHLVNYTKKFYETGDNGMPLNSFFKNTGIHCTAQDFSDLINKWLDNTPAGKWPNWEFENHDFARSTDRLGPGMVDAINAMILLLPGSPVLYYGQEIGQVNTYVTSDERQDYTNKEGGLEVTRDHMRCPMQWDDSMSAGFSSNPRTWLPVNPDYYRVNVADQRQADVSHYKIVQRLIRLRSDKVFQHGGVKTYVLANNVLAFTRFLQGEPTYIVLINFSSFVENINLKPIQIKAPTLTVHTASVNSEYQIGNTIVTASLFSMTTKSCLVLTTSPPVKLPSVSSTSVDASQPVWKKFLNLVL